jgi:hypothetical protein
MDQLIGQSEPDDLERVGWPIIIIEISVRVDEGGSHSLVSVTGDCDSENKKSELAITSHHHLHIINIKA